MKRALLVLVTMVISLSLKAQGNIFSKADSLLYRYQHRETYDSLYMERNLDRWLFCTRSNVSDNTILTTGLVDGDRFYTLSKNGLKYTQSFTVGYRGIYLTAAVNPGIFYGRNNDNIELSLSGNGNMLGGEIIYQKADAYSGKAILGENEFLLPKGSTSTQIFDASGYYVFNHKKFSISAATNQGYIQKHSAGSFILTAAIKGGRSHFSEIMEIGRSGIDISYASFAIGGGYGYNHVFSNGLMVHASLRAALVVYNGGGVINDSGVTKIPLSFPDFVINGNFAIVYPFRKYFTGLGATLRDDTYGNTDDIFIDNCRYKINIFFGFRL